MANREQATKVIALETTDERKKLSLAECRKTLNEEGFAYSDNEAIQIRDFLYQLAAISFEHFNRVQPKQEARIIELTSNNYDTEKSHSLHPGEYRRAG